MLLQRANLIATLLGLVTVVMTVAAPLHSAEVRDFRYCKNAHCDGLLNKPDIAIISFDAEIYRSTANLFSDLMVTDASLKPLPFMVEKQSRIMLVSHPEECPSKTLSVSADRQTFEIENINRIYVSEIRLSPASGTYEKAVDIFCSNDRNSWKALKKGLIIFNVESLKMSQPGISFLADSSRYFKVVVRTPDVGHICPGDVMFVDKSFSEASLHQGAIRIDGVTLYHDITLSRTVDANAMQIELRLASHRVVGNDCETMMASMNQPLLGFRINFPEDNRPRELAIFGGNDGKNWTLLNEGTYINLVLPGYRRQHNFFNITESRYKYYLFRYTRIGSGQEMDMTVKAHSAIFNIVMPGGIPADIKVFYGGKVAPVKFDLSALRRIKDPLTAEYHLSSQDFNDDYGLDSHLSPLKIFFTVVIILIAIILGLIMRKFVRSYSRFRDGPL